MGREGPPDLAGQDHVVFLQKQHEAGSGQEVAETLTSPEYFVGASEIQGFW